VQMKLSVCRLKIAFQKYSTLHVVLSSLEILYQWFPKGIISRDWGGLLMIWLNIPEVKSIYASCLFLTGCVLAQYFSQEEDLRRAQKGTPTENIGQRSFSKRADFWLILQKSSSSKSCISGDKTYYIQLNIWLHNLHFIFYNRSITHCFDTLYCAFIIY
jgi:hypothetical protein